MTTPSISAAEARIRAAIYYATPGEWAAKKPDWHTTTKKRTHRGWIDSEHGIHSLADPEEDGEVIGMIGYDSGGILRKTDQEYIAACNPAAIKELLNELDSLRGLLGY